MKEIGCMTAKHALINLKKFDQGLIEDFIVDGRGGLTIFNAFYLKILLKYFFFKENMLRPFLTIILNSNLNVGNLLLSRSIKKSAASPLWSWQNF
jgi:hypothetical protein